MEEWKPVPEFEESYEVSNMGRVRSLDRVREQKHWRGGTSHRTYKGRIIKLHARTGGYLNVNLHRPGRRQKPMRVHRLVLIAFKPIDNPHEMESNHMNHVVTDNRLCNLNWVTKSENEIHKRPYKHGPNARTRKHMK